MAQLQAAIRQVLDEPDLDASLTAIVDAICALGWRRAVLALYSDIDEIKVLFTSGTVDEPPVTAGAVIPAAIWQRYLDGDLAAHRVSGLYYIPQGQPGNAWQRDDLVFAPLRRGQGPVLGVIRAEQPVSGERPSPETLRPIDILASQAAYLVEHARLLDEAACSAAVMADQIEELSMIRQADRELSSHLDMEHVITLTMDWALRQAAASTGLLCLMTDNKKGLVPYIKMGYLLPDVLNWTERNPWPLDRGAIGRAARTGEVQIVRALDMEAGAYYFIGEDSRAQLCVPLVMRGEVLGVVTLESNDDAAFDAHTSNFLERLAQRAAVALDNARLFRQSEQLADDMAVLYSAGRAITATLERDEVLKRIAQSMAVALECSSAMILDYQPERLEAQVLVVYRVGTARNSQEVLPPLKTVLPLGDYSTLIDALARRRPVILRAADAHTPAMELDLMQQMGVQAMMLMPLVAQEEVVGLALVIEGRQDRVFSPNDIFKAETLGSQASVALRQALLYNEVRELEKLKSEMIRMASHDLRNPLGNLMGYVELLDMSFRRTGKTSEQDEFLNNVRRSAKIMQSLIDDLLTLERVESEREAQWQVFDLGALVYEVVEAARSSANLKRQIVRLERAATGTLAYGSVTQLRQVIANLVGNAIKYTPDEGQIEVSLSGSDERLEVIVRDNGYGISPERQVRIFERFYRAREPGTDHIVGTGLGLSLVKTVVERHSGQVWFESTPGVGSTFGFWLPPAPPQGRTNRDRA
jgi:signal transduction histidine kinase